MAKTGPGGKSGAGHTHLIPANLVGAQGPSGAQGPTGATGPAGANGTNGAAGPNVTILTHTGPPISTDGTFALGQVALDSTNVPYVCTVAGTPGTWGYLALNNASGVIGSNVTLPTNTPTKIMDTASLAVGLWLIIFTVMLKTAAATGRTEVSVAQDGATASFSGPQVVAFDDSTGDLTSAAVSQTLAVYATVTTAGTIKITGDNTSGSSATILAASPNGTSGATGYAAVRIG